MPPPNSEAQRTLGDAAGPESVITGNFDVLKIAELHRQQQINFAVSADGDQP